MDRKNAISRLKIENYEHLKKMISKQLKVPINPTSEVRKMRKKLQHATD